MTMHTPHPDIREHGLADDCPRCAEHAEHPVQSLDTGNLRRIMQLAVDFDARFDGTSHLDQVAAAKVATDLEHAGHLARTAPDLFIAFIARYGVVLSLADHLTHGRA